MRTLILIPFIVLLMSFTHPFAKEGSVDTDRDLLEERMDKAHQNELQEKRAEEAIRQEQQSDEELDRNLQPDILLQDNDKKEGSVE